MKDRDGVFLITQTDKRRLCPYPALIEEVLIPIARQIPGPPHGWEFPVESEQKKIWGRVQRFLRKKVGFLPDKLLVFAGLKLTFSCWHMQLVRQRPTDEESRELLDITYGLMVVLEQHTGADGLQILHIL